MSAPGKVQRAGTRSVRCMLGACCAVAHCVQARWYCLVGAIINFHVRYVYTTWQWCSSYITAVVTLVCPAAAAVLVAAKAEGQQCMRRSRQEGRSMLQCSVCCCSHMISILCCSCTPALYGFRKVCHMHHRDYYSVHLKAKVPNNMYQIAARTVSDTCNMLVYT